MKCHEGCQHPKCTLSACPLCGSPVMHELTRENGKLLIEYYCNSCNSKFDRFHQRIRGPFCLPGTVAALRRENGLQKAVRSSSPTQVHPKA